MPKVPDRLQRQFKAERPNQAWVSDITYVRTRQSWLYLAIVLDLFSRRVVGWSMDASLANGLHLNALRMALKNRRPLTGLLNHWDRGSQYTSDAYQQVLRAHQALPSFGKVGSCFDNAAMESFFGTLKTEWLYFQHFDTRQEAMSSIFITLSHSTIGNGGIQLMSISARLLLSGTLFKNTGKNMTKPTFNILITDHTQIEWLATLFKNSVYGIDFKRWVKVDIEWKQKPVWTQKSYLPLKYLLCEQKNSVLCLYSFPEAIKRDFELADLVIDFDAILFIVDLGDKELWEKLSSHSYMPTEIENSSLMTPIEQYLDVNRDVSSRIWGIRLLNQMEGVKLILGIKSSTECVPSTHIKKYLPVNSPIDIMIHNVNHDNWLDFLDSYPPHVIRDTLMALEHRLTVNLDSL